MAAENRDKTVDAAADKSKPVIMMLIVLAILVLVFTPIVTILALKAFMPQDGETAQTQLKKGAEVSLELFKFNVAGSQGTRFAQVQVVLELSDEDMKPIFADKTPENPDGIGKRITAEILDILSERSLDGLLSKEARNSLRKEIQTKLNGMLSDRKVKGVVVDVYFPSFLVQ